VSGFHPLALVSCVDGQFPLSYRKEAEAIAGRLALGTSTQSMKALLFAPRAAERNMEGLGSIAIGIRKFEPNGALHHEVAMIVPCTEIGGRTTRGRSCTSPQQSRGCLGFPQ
jgi:hypothetical protein